MLRVLRGLCQNPSDADLSANLGVVVGKQVDFGTVELNNLLAVVQSFAAQHGGHLPSTATLLVDAQRLHGHDSPTARAVEAVERFSPLAGANFEHAVDQAIYDQAVDRLKRLMGDAAAKAARLAGRKTLGQLVEEVTADVARGLLEAQQRARRHRVETRGNLTAEAVMTPYRRQFAGELSQPPALGTLTGFWDIDQPTHGFRPGELVLVAGYTGELKSTLCRNMLYNMVTLFGRNVVYFSCESSYRSSRDQFVVLHSNHPKWGRPPLDYRLVKSRLLDQSSASFFDEVAKDLAEPANGHGALHVEQPSERRFRWSDVVLQSNTKDAEFPGGLDVVCLDYYDFVEWDGPKGDDTPTNEMIKESKQFAVSFHSGRGCVFLAPFQMNNEGYAYAQRHDGEYQVSHLSTHNQARRAADFVVSTYLGPEGSKFRNAGQVKVCCLKNRDGDPFKPLVLSTGLASGFISPSNMLDDSATAQGDGSSITASEAARQALQRVLADI